METTLHSPLKTTDQPAACALNTDVRVVGGQAVFHINGRPHHGFFSSAPAPHMKSVLDAGFDIVDTHPQTSTGWVGANTYDYTETDERIESFLDQSPDALLIIRFWMGYPNREGDRQPFWWAAENPDECIRPLDVADGATMPWDDLNNNASWGQLIAASTGLIAAPAKKQHPPKPSFASLKFREEAGEALCRVIRHVEEKYGDRIAGYVIGGGPCGEWFHWHADEARMMDYGTPMRRHFQRWLRQKHETIDALNGAWGSAYRDFSEIAPPTPEERFRPAFRNLRSAVTERKTLEFYDALHRTVADTLLHWVAKAKEGCGRGKALMVFYGYLWNHNYGDAQARSGHAHLHDVLKSPDVDVLVAPFCYSLRQMEGVITGQSVAASARLHGKLYLHELDGSTSLKPCWNCPDHHNPETPAETGALFRREMNKMLTEGSAGWYMDLRSGYFDSPEIVSELRATLQSGIRARAEAGAPNTQVAVVLDPRTPFYYREGEPFLSPLIDAFKQHSLAGMGLGFDDLTLDDLVSLSPEKTERYRLWIFPSAVHLNPSQRDAIRRHACRGGNHVLWNYAVNVGDGVERPDLAGMEEMTGFHCGVSLEPGELSVRVEPGEHSLFRDVTKPVTYGTRGDLSPDQIKHHAILGLYATSQHGFQVTPRFFIREGGEKLGQLEGFDPGVAGLATRQMAGWTSVLSCAPLIPPVLLRAMAARAGCHVYTSTPGQLVHCENFVGLFAHADGECTLALPRKTELAREWYSGQVLGRGVDSVRIQVEKNGTYLIHY